MLAVGGVTPSPCASLRKRNSMSGILDVGSDMPAFLAALSDCLRSGKLYQFSGAMVEKRECPKLAFAVEVSTWKMLA